jgi:ABC-type nitrate/sulfonate/bicarbonate transport system substrate-binding protein
MRTMKARLVIAGLAAGLLLTACGGSADDTTTAEGTGTSGGQGTQSLVFAYPVDSPNLSDVQISIAQDEGLFEKLGLKVEYKFLNGAAPGFQALIADQADLSWLGADQFYKAAQSGEKLKAVLDVAPGSQYYLLANDKIKSWNDLATARVGISQPGTLSQSIVQLAMQANTVDSSKTQWLAVGGSGARRQALVSNRIDAGIGHATDVVSLAASGIKPFADLTEVLPDLQGYVTVGKQATVDKKRDAIIKFSAALIQGARMAYDDKELAVKEFVKYRKGATEEDASKAYDLLREGAWNRDGGMNQQSYTYTTQTLIDSGTLKAPAPSFESLYDLELQKAALKLADETWGSAK